MLKQKFIENGGNSSETQLKPIQTMCSGFVDSSDDQWQKVKKADEHDFYHLPEYAELDAKLIQGTAKCWVAETEHCQIWIPLVERKIPENITKGKDYRDITSPYGYPGILFSELLSPFEFNKMIQRYQEDAAENNYITSFLRMNPISNPFTWQQTELIQQVYHGYTITIPLDRDIDSIRKNYSANHRKNIKKLRRKGFKFWLDEADHYDDFVTIYEQTMNRLNASEYYYFSKWYFDRLFEMVGNRIHLATVTAPGGDVAAGGIITDFNGVMQSHLTATKTDYLKEAPSKLMFDGIVHWAAGTHRKYFHLGGGLNSKEDSLYRFKKGFSSIKNQFSTLRIIHDKQRYNNLNYIALQENGQQKFADPHYFPLYRQL